MTTAKVAGTKIAGVRKRKPATSCPKKGARKKIGTKTYTVKGNHKTKTEATKSANATRKTGKLARILKTATCGYTVVIAGTAKKKATTAKAKCTCPKKKKTTARRTTATARRRKAA